MSAAMVAPHEQTTAALEAFLADRDNGTRDERTAAAEELSIRYAAQERRPAESAV